MATVTVTEMMDGSRVIIKRIVATGVDSTTETAVVAAEECTAPNDREGHGFGDVVLMEASWAISPGYDHAKLYYEDETNDLHILTMSGVGEFNARGYGGVSAEEVADEGNAAVAADMVVKLDLIEGAGEVAAASDAADITLVFKKKDHKA